MTIIEKWENFLALVVPNDSKILLCDSAAFRGSSVAQSSFSILNKLF